MLSVDTHCIMHTGVVFPSLFLSVQELILVFVYYNSNYYFLDLDSQIKMSTDIGSRVHDEFIMQVVLM